MEIEPRPRKEVGRPTIEGRALALAPKGARSRDGVAEETIVEAGADGVEDGNVEHFMAEERPVRADGRPAPIARGTAVEPSSPTVPARAM